MELVFIHIRILDFIDILLVAFLLYQLYSIIKGTAAINIFIGIFSVYLLWLIVKALNMQLLGSILGQVIGVGVIALIIVFQQEIRRFLLILGSRYFSKERFSIENWFGFYSRKKAPRIKINSIVLACKHMSASKTGALITIKKNTGLRMYAESGDILDAETSSRLLESIFFKNSPLHDGAVIIEGKTIVAARCVLPSTNRMDVPAHYGMRHRAALGITEETDALAIIVSEETGRISLADSGEFLYNLNPDELKDVLLKRLDMEPIDKKQQSPDDNATV